MEHNRDNLLHLIQSGMQREGFSVSGLERQSGVPKDTIRDFLRAKTQVLRADKLQKILGVLEPAGKVAVSGHVSENAEIVPAPPTINELVDCPAGMSPADVIALKIVSDAMLPVFHKEWIVYYPAKHNITLTGKPKSGWQVPYNKRVKKNAADEKAAENDPLYEFFGKPCIVQIKKGPLMLRTLKRGSTPGHYHLVSYNAQDIKNAEVEWAAKIIFIKT